MPGQSLALLNDPFVIEQAARWADGANPQATADERVRSMFKAALAWLKGAPKSFLVWARPACAYALVHDAALASKKGL